MKKLITILAILGGLTAGTLVALDPGTIPFSWDYNLSANNGVRGFQIFTLNNDGTHGALVAEVPLPPLLPAEDETGFAVYTAEVVPDKTGRREFVVVVITADPNVFSDDSNVVAKVIKPDTGKLFR